MRYRGNYGTYYRGGDGNESYGRRMRDSRGRYMDGGNYGRRGVDAKYRGEDAMQDMYESYFAYSDSNSYGHDEEGDKAFEYMVKAGLDFIDSLEDQAKTPKQREMIEHFRREVSSK